MKIKKILCKFFCKTYKNLDDMVDHTGIRCYINGKEFRSINEAASWIAKNRTNVKKSTIARELRRIKNKKRKNVMYDIYHIDF